MVGLDAQRALPLGDGESGLAAQRVQPSEVVARLRVRVVLKAERRLQSLLCLVPATESREHDAEVVLRARVVAVTLRDGLSVSLDRRVRLAETRQRVPRVVEEGRVEPLLGKHLAQELDGFALAPRPGQTFGQLALKARALRRTRRRSYLRAQLVRAVVVCRGPPVR